MEWQFCSNSCQLLQYLCGQNDFFTSKNLFVSTCSSVVLVSTYCRSGISSSVSQSESTASRASSLVPRPFIKNALATYPSLNCWLPLPCSWQYQSDFRTLHVIVLEFQLRHTSRYNKYTSSTYLHTKLYDVLKVLTPSSWALSMILLLVFFKVN